MKSMATILIQVELGIGDTVGNFMCHPAWSEVIVFPSNHQGWHIYASQFLPYIMGNTSGCLAFQSHKGLRVWVLGGIFSIFRQTDVYIVAIPRPFGIDQ